MNDNLKKKLNSLVRNCTKTELIKQCKELDFDTSGTKQDLALRLLKVDGGKSKVNQKDFENPNLVLKIEKNKFGNYTHNESNMVFDPHTKKVIGVQQENGNVRTLNRNDIEICKKFKFQYNMPTMLDPSPIYEILENSDKEESETELSEAEEDLEEEDEDEETFED